MSMSKLRFNITSVVDEEDRESLYFNVDASIKLELTSNDINEKVKNFTKLDEVIEYILSRYNYNDDEIEINHNGKNIPIKEEQIVKHIEPPVKSTKLGLLNTKYAEYNGNVYILKVTDSKNKLLGYATNKGWLPYLCDSTMVYLTEDAVEAAKKARNNRHCNDDIHFIINTLV